MQSLEQSRELLEEAEPASFRDPAGFVFRRNGLFYRRIGAGYSEEYRRLMDSGLYAKLVGEGLLIPHEEIDENLLFPQQLTFVSYPFEWSFGQWKDAALATLAIQKTALEHGMSLKDASAFNIQFDRGNILLIDTLSFENYTEGAPWVAYRQFCEHFLAPLALMSYTDIRLGALMRTHMDGVPLSLAAKLLPWRARLNFPLFFHIFLQAGFQDRGMQKPTTEAQNQTVTKQGLLALIETLQSAVQGLTWQPGGTVWGDYYEGTNYTRTAMGAKESLVVSFLERADPVESLWDFGANDARFTRLASERGIPTVAFDVDPAAVEKAYRQVRANKETNLLPLLLDLTNPTPDQGWALKERKSVLSRGPADAVMALALVHHLAIGHNVPLNRISDFFAEAARQWLIVEFVPKEDSQTQRLLANRPDIFPEYHRAGFEASFAPRWQTVRQENIPETERTLYLLRKREE